MGFLQIKNMSFNFNLKKPLTFVHFSDVHAISLNKYNGDAAIKLEDLWYKQREWFAKNYNEKCNEKQMIPSAKCLHKLINYSNNTKADVIFLTGDIIDYYSKYNYRLLEKEIKRINKPYVFACGNHETPVDKYQDLTSSFGEIDLDEIKIVYLDNSTKLFSKEQYEFLLDQLKDNKPIVLAMHEPILTRHNKKKMSIFDTYFVINYKNEDDYTKKTVDLIYKNELFKLILCGHVHGFNKSAFAKNRYQICASSGLIGKVNKITIK